MRSTGYSRAAAVAGPASKDIACWSGYCVRPDVWRRVCPRDWGWVVYDTPLLAFETAQYGRTGMFNVVRNSRLGEGSDLECQKTVAY